MGHPLHATPQACAEASARIGRILTLPPHATGWRCPRRRSTAIPNGDEDIAPPNPFQKGAVSRCACTNPAGHRAADGTAGRTALTDGRFASGRRICDVRMQIAPSRGPSRSIGATAHPNSNVVRPKTWLSRTSGTIPVSMPSGTARAERENTHGPGPRRPPAEHRLRAPSVPKESIHSCPLAGDRFRPCPRS